MMNNTIKASSAEHHAQLDCIIDTWLNKHYANDLLEEEVWIQAEKLKEALILHQPLDQELLSYIIRELELDGKEETEKFPYMDAIRKFHEANLQVKG
jgi:hypothetical protein